MEYTAVLVGGENSGRKIKMKTIVGEIECVAGECEGGYYTEVYVRQLDFRPINNGSTVIFKVRE